MNWAESGWTNSTEKKGALDLALTMGSGPVGGGGSRPDEELEQAGPCQRGREALTSGRSTQLHLWSSRSTTGEAEDLEAAGLHPPAIGMART